MKKLKLILIAIPIAVITAILIAAFTNVVSAREIKLSEIGKIGDQYGFAIATLTDSNNVYCVEIKQYMGSTKYYTLATEISITGNVAIFNNNSSTRCEGDYNNILAAILCDGELGYGREDAYNDSQTALYYYWNDWLGYVQSATGSTFGMYTGGENKTVSNGYTVFQKYKEYASKKQYNVKIYYFYRDNRQNVILVERGPATSKSMSIPVEKVWNDSGNAYFSRPSSIKVNLYWNGGYTGKSLTLNAGNGWRGTFTGLEDKTGYSVLEESIPGYNTSYYGSQSSTFYISNTLQTTNIKVTKTWNDDTNRDGKRPRNNRCNFI